MKIINLTKHDLFIADMDGNKLIELPAKEKEARLVTAWKVVTTTTAKEAVESTVSIYDLMDLEPNVLIVVNPLLKQYFSVQRGDLIEVGDVICENGRPIGVVRMK